MLTCITPLALPIPLRDYRDIVLGRPVKVDLPSVAEKFVPKGRGGYCFEHNTVFQAALESIGFDVTPLLARVVYMQPAETASPRAHMVLVVRKLGDVDLLVDVGFGAQGPTAPLAIGTDAEQHTPHERYRVLHYNDGSELLVQARDGSGLRGWVNLYRALVREPITPVDILTMNWFVSTFTPGLFTDHFLVAKPVVGGAGSKRLSLFNGTFVERSSETGEAISRRDIRGVDEYRDVLCGSFGLALTDEELSALAEKGDQYAAEKRAHPIFQSS